MNSTGVVSSFAKLSGVVSLSLLGVLGCESKSASNPAASVDSGRTAGGTTGRTAGGVSGGFQKAHPHADAIVHMFNVPFDVIRSELDEIAKNGYGAIQISPPQLSNGAPWWGRYQPLDYRIIDSPLGNENQLQELIREAHKRGIKIYADLVLNHMANLGAFHDGKYPPQWAQEKYGVNGLFSPQDFNPSFCIQNWTNAEEVRRGRLCGGGSDTGLPDLRQDSDWVLGVHRNFISKLNALGIDGYRIDAVKHMEPSYFAKLFDGGLGANKFIYGEVIAFKENFQDIETYLRLTPMSFMDFPMQGTLRSAFSPEGGLQSLVNPVSEKGALAWDRAVTFAVNHDLPNNEGFRSMILDRQDEFLSLVYLSTRSEGIPHHMSDLGLSDGLTTDRWKHSHRNKTLAKVLKFRNEVHPAGQKFLWTDKCSLVYERADKGLVGINKCGFEVVQTVQTRVRGQVEDLLTGNQQAVTENGVNFKVAIPGRGAVVLLAKN